MTKSLFCELPLTPEDAYWHACTGTPYVPHSAPVVYDRGASPGPPSSIRGKSMETKAFYQDIDAALQERGL